MVKTDASGSVVWMRTFDGSDEDRGGMVRQTRDEGYIITGYTRPYGEGHAYVWLIKTNADGDVTWTRVFGGSDEDAGSAVQQTRDGGYIITGYTGSFGAGGADVWLIKTDADGDTVWARTFGGAGDDRGGSVQQTQDGGFVIAGYTCSHGAGGRDVWLIKTDTNGDSVWTRTFGGAGSDYAVSVEETQDGGYVIAGYTKSYGAGGTDAWLIKTDSMGDTVWTRTFGGTEADGFSAVQQTQDGGYMLAGTTSSYGWGWANFWLIKTDAEGRVNEGGGK